MAAATWTAPNPKTSKAVSASGTTDAPTLVTEGLDLYRTKGFFVTAEADGAQTLSGAGALTAYFWDDAFAAWSRVPAMDLATTTATVRRLSLHVSAPANRGRIAYAPTGVTVSGGGVTIYITAAALD